MAKYIYQNKNWTNFNWEDTIINRIFGEVRNLQGKLSGQINSLGFSGKDEAKLYTLTQDVVKSSEIEGELLNFDQVRSSIARRLGMMTNLVRVERHVDGIVEMMLDATQNYQEPLTEERLFGWHNALFPTGYSGMYKIEVARYRSKEMQIVSGAIDRPIIHFEAPDPHIVKAEMDKFLGWFNSETDMDPVLKAAIAHFWFIIIHPFDDGNGRMARAISDMLLTRAEGSPDRFYSMSAQILKERKKYYKVLQSVQYSDGDITEWMEWFMQCLKNALLETERTFNGVLIKSRFWVMHETTPLNERQRLVINKLLDGFEGKMKSSKWAKIAKCSADTALRDIKDLIEKNILRQEDHGGRSTSYELVIEELPAET